MVHMVTESMDLVGDWVRVSFQLLRHTRTTQTDFLCYLGNCRLDCDLLLRSELLFRMYQGRGQYI